MASATSFTALRAADMFDQSIIEAEVDPVGQLILGRRNASTIDAGMAKGDPGEQGEEGPPGEDGPPGVSGSGSGIEQLGHAAFLDEFLDVPSPATDYSELDAGAFAYYSVADGKLSSTALNVPATGQTPALLLRNTPLEGKNIRFAALIEAAPDWSIEFVTRYKDVNNYCSMYTYQSGLGARMYNVKKVGGVSSNVFTGIQAAVPTTGKVLIVCDVLDDQHAMGLWKPPLWPLSDTLNSTYNTFINGNASLNDDTFDYQVGMGFGSQHASNPTTAKLLLWGAGILAPN